MDATARFVAIIAVAAFVTERIVAAIDYLINAVRGSRAPVAGSAQEPAREWRKLVLFFIAALIAYVVVDVANLRLLSVLQVDNVHPLVDFWLTWLVVLAGAPDPASAAHPESPASAETTHTATRTRGTRRSKVMGS